MSGLPWRGMWVLGETEILPPALQDYPQIIKRLVVRVEASRIEFFPVDCSRLLGSEAQFHNDHTNSRRDQPSNLLNCP